MNLLPMGALQRLASVLVLITVLMLSIALIDFAITNPVSPWHDELWNLYSSFQFFGIENGIWPGCAQAMCVNVLGIKIPMLSGPYHGILKAFLFSPLSLLGNVSLIRCLNIGFYLLPLAYFFTKRKSLGVRGAGLVAASYYCLFPILFFEAIFDQGQFVVPNALFAIASLELVQNLRSYSPRRLVFVILLSALAVYEKITNLPVAFAISAVAFALLLVNRNYRFARISLLILGLGTPYLIYLSQNMATFVSMTIAPKSNYLANLGLVGHTAYDGLFSRSSTVSSIIGGNVVIGLPALAFVLVALAWGVSLVLCLRSNRAIGPCLTVSVPLLAILIFPVFDGLDRPWHVYQLAPLTIIPFSYLVTMRSLGEKTPVIVLIVLLGLGAVNSSALVAGSVNSVRQHPYDSSLIDTADFIKAGRISKNLVCLDYSVCYPLTFMLGSDYNIIADFAFSPVQDICNALGAIKGKGFYLIAHLDQTLDQNSSRQASYDRQPIDETYRAFLYGRSAQFIQNCAKGFIDLSKNMANTSVPGYRIFVDPTN